MHTNNTKNLYVLGFLGVLATVLVGIGEYLLHYSPMILEHAQNYEFFQFVSARNLSYGHVLVVIGLPLYFAGYFHIFGMLKSGNKRLAQAVLILGIIAFAVGGVWIGSRSSIGTIVHLREAMNPDSYQQLINFYTNHLEILVMILRYVIALLSIFFISAVLKGGTLYKKWMWLCNPIFILIALVFFGKLIPAFGKHSLPILMNVTHFILFGLSLYNLRRHTNQQKL